MVAGIGRAVDGRQPAGRVVGIIDARAVGVVQGRPPRARVVGILRQGRAALVLDLGQPVELVVFVGDIGAVRIRDFRASTLVNNQTKKVPDTFNFSC